MSKQDRQGARTVSDLERKYKFGESFAEVMGLATDARTAANNAQTSADLAQETADAAIKLTVDLDSSLNQEEIFQRLTNNGELQGFYLQDGKLYINSEFVQILNLVADTIVSRDSHGGSMSVQGGVFRLKEDNTVMVEITTDDAGYPSFRMFKLDDGALTRCIFVGADGVQLIDLSGATPAIKFGIDLGTDNAATISCPDESGALTTKKAVWKLQADGTHILTGV
jgi:hypothetical protein